MAVSVVNWPGCSGRTREELTERHGLLLRLVLRRDSGVRAGRRYGTGAWFPEQPVGSEGDILYGGAGCPLGRIPRYHDDEVGVIGAAGSSGEDHAGVAEGIAVGPDLVGDAGSLRQWPGKTVLEGCVRHEVEHLGGELWGCVGGIGDGLQHEEDIVRGRGVGDPVRRRSRAYLVELGLYVPPSQIAVEHFPGGVVALLDHVL